MKYINITTADLERPMTDIETRMIKRDHFEALRHSRVILIVEVGDGYEVQQWLPDEVAPTSSYETAVAAAARALQLLKIREPVTPQSWPEVAQIGEGGGPSPISRERAGLEEKR